MTPQEQQILTERMGLIREDLNRFLDKLENLGWEMVVYDVPERWTVEDTVRHLIQAEKSMVRLMDGIRQGHPGTPADFDLAAFNRSGIARIGNLSRGDLRTALDTARTRTMSFIDSLSDADWHCRGRHAIGRVLSIAEICNVIADHEKGHLSDMLNQAADHTNQ